MEEGKFFRIENGVLMRGARWDLFRRYVALAEAFTCKISSYDQIIHGEFHNREDGVDVIFFWENRKFIVFSHKEKTLRLACSYWWREGRANARLCRALKKAMRIHRNNLKNIINELDHC